MNNKNSVIVAHPNRQHSYQTAAAFQKSDTLICYITMLYKKQHSLLGRVTSILPTKLSNKINKYNSNLLDENKVIQVCEIFALFVQFLSILPGLKFLYEIANSALLKRFNRKLARIVMELKPDILITYDTLSGDALEILIKNNFPVIKIIDMSAPYLGEMKTIFDIKLNNSTEQLQEVRKKFDSRDYKERLIRSRKELEYADFYICASEFTKKSLILNGINENRISICRYGTSLAYNAEPIDDFKLSPDKRKLSGLYIGNVSYTKGVQYIVQAIKSCPECIKTFTYIGAIQNPLIVIEADKKIESFTGYISHEEVLNYCKKADFSVFPSLADGFGFAVIESMAAGIPVICSENAGACDLIEDGVNGFIVEAGNAMQISEKIKWFYKNPEETNQMKKNAIHSIKQLTIENYNNDLAYTIKELYEHNNNIKL
ncbi:MAG: glycosyltransferase family 4 protein [Eubacteriales bacterium]|nr:glycosyltransferase family 4 protein [Eubacteriales bacterium]